MLRQRTRQELGLRVLLVDLDKIQDEKGGKDNVCNAIWNKMK